MTSTVTLAVIEPQSPLTGREISILRGMMDEYETERLRRAMLGQWWRDGRAFAVALAAVVMFSLDVLLRVLALLGHGH